MITIIYNDGTEEQVKDLSEATIAPGSGILLFLHDKQVQDIIAKLDYIEIMKRYYLDHGYSFVTTTGR